MLSTQKEQNTIFINAEGTLKDDDYDLLVPELNKMLEHYDKVNMYFRMQNFEGWTITAMWRDLKLDVKYRDRFNKIAIVGDKKWQELMATVMEPFTSADISHFTSDENEKALEYVKEEVSA